MRERLASPPVNLQHVCACVRLNLPSTAPPLPAVGLAESSFYNTSTSCYDSSAPPPAHSSSSADTAVIVAATVGSVVGVALLAAAVFLLYRRKRRQQLRPRDLEQLSKQGSGEDLSSLPSGKLSSVGTLQGKPPMSGQASGELQSHLLRARFGPIDGVQLGELLGRGAFGRVYRGAKVDGMEGGEGEQRCTEGCLR